MNKRQIEVEKYKLDEERKLVNNLRRQYQSSAKEVNKKVKILQEQIEGLTEQLKAMPNDEVLESMLQSKIYQKGYQEALKKQIDGIIDGMNTNKNRLVKDFLDECYNTGFCGAMYDMHGQGVPLVLGVDPKLVAKAVRLDSPISRKLYGEYTNQLKERIRSEISRGVSTAMSYADIARNISNVTNIGFNKTMRIARTEGHRIQQVSTLDAQKGAKSKGADVVKQWDATLDGKTRETHRMLDGQIREIEEPFQGNGKEAMHPGGFGSASEDVNCRCTSLQRARWALDEEELEKLKEKAAYHGLDKTKDFDDFKKKYLKAEKEVAKVPKGGNIELYPDSLAGVKRGEQMTFEQADSFHVNPNYGKQHGYDINCQSCVVTFEARQRGYNVMTKANTKGSMAEKLSYKTNLAWIDPKTGKNPDYIFDKSKVYTAKTYRTYLESIIEQGNRYTIEFGWKGRSRSGHIVNIDRTDSGELRIKDNQRGTGEKSEWIGSKEISSYLSELKYSTSVYGNKFSTPPKVLRIDNMEFDLDVLKGIMEGVKK